MMQRTVRYLAIVLAAQTLAACGPESFGSPTAEERAGTATQALLAPNSLVLEQDETIPNASNATLATLEAIDDVSNGRRSQFVVALQGTSPAGLRVQLRTLTDEEGGGKSVLDDEDAVLITGLRRIRVVGVGADNFVVATRESNRLVLRSFAVVDDALELQSTLDTGENVTEMELTRVFQADPAFFQLAAVVQKTDGKTRVMTWKIDPATGTFTAQATFTRPTATPVTRMSIAGVERPFGLVITAEALAGTTVLTPWKIDEAGVSVPKAALSESSVASEVSMVRSGYASVNVTRNPTSGPVAELATYEWNEASQSLARRNFTSFGNGSEDPRGAVAVHATGSRLFVVGSTSSGSWTARSWTTVDGQKKIDGRVGSSGTYGVSSGTTVRADRLMVAAVNGTGGVQLMTFHDYNAPLFQATYTPGPLQSIPTVANNATTFGFDAQVNAGGELLIASSPKFVVTCGTGECSYLDKAGARLPVKYTGVPTRQKIIDLFKPLQDKFLNRLHVQYVCDAVEKNQECPLHDQSQIFDTKLIYSSTINRFIIVGQLRHGDLPGHDKWSAHIGIAVSVTEDPRDGFYVYANGDSLVRDNLSAAAGGGMLIVTHGGSSDSVLRPVVWLFDLRDLANAAPFVRNGKVMASQVGNSTGNLLAPLQYSDDPEATEFGFFTGRVGAATGRRIYAVKRPLGGPVEATSYRATEQYNSSNNTEIDAVEVFEHSTNDGTVLARWWDTGLTDASGGFAQGSRTHLGLKSVTVTLSPTEGIVSGTTDIRAPIACPQDGAANGVSFGCSRPNVTARNGSVFLTFLRPDSNNNWGFGGLYLKTVSSTPKFVQLGAAEGPHTGFPNSSIQTANVVPDGATSWGGDFWGIQVVSRSESSTPSSAFKAKGARAFEP